jgi:hypothetical protein
LLDIFLSYLKLGFQHIVDINGFDHLLFVITLCAVYQLKEWRKIVIVITAFTLGHSITLVLASLKIIIPNRHIIELLIPLTILISAVFNLIAEKYELKSAKLWVKYAFALFFGLIHGMSFSSFFTDIMGDATGIVLPLFSFNVGIEVGQFFVISLYYFLIYLIYKLFKTSYKRFAWFFSVLGIIVSIVLIYKRF